MFSTGMAADQAGGFGLCTHSGGRFCRRLLQFLAYKPWEFIPRIT